METGLMHLGQSEFVKGQVVVLLLADIVQSSRWWGWLRIVQGSAALRSVPGLLFAKLLGSGHEGGFGLKPSASRQGLFALFESAQTADGSKIPAKICRVLLRQTSNMVVSWHMGWVFAGRSRNRTDPWTGGGPHKGFDQAQQSSGFLATCAAV